MSELRASSRYNFSVLYIDSKNGDFYGTRQPLKLREHDSDLFHTVTDADSKRIDLIAYKFYGDVSLWWVIAEFNGISNPLEIPAGTVLRIPTYERVQMEVIALLILTLQFSSLRLADRNCLMIFQHISRISLTKRMKRRWTS